MWQTPTGRHIAAIVRGAVSVNETILARPQTYRNTPVTAAEMNRFLHRAQRRLADYFTGSELASWRKVAASTFSTRDLRSDSDSPWAVYWKVDWVHLGGLTLFPGRLTATAAASAEYANDLTLNRLDYTLHLQRTPIGWRVDRMDSQFEPGYGP
jgi:hypothetical protein